MAIYLRGKSWYYDFIHKGQRYTGSFGHVSRTVAKEELARKKAEVVEERLNPAKARKSPRFDLFAAEYLDWVRTNFKPETYRRLSSQSARLCTFFATTKLNNITPWHLEQYKNTTLTRLWPIKPLRGGHRVSTLRFLAGIARG